MAECFKISKLDAARSQLETAIMLYFNEADPVSIHTLAAASYEILQDLSSNTKRPTFLDQSLAILPQDLRKKIRDEARKPQNFFKHARKDVEASIEFVPGLTEWTLIDATAKYIDLADNDSLMLRVYVTWFTARYPEIWGHTPFQRANKEVCRMSRKEFFLSRGLVLMEVTPS